MKIENNFNVNSGNTPELLKKHNKLSAFAFLISPLLMHISKKIPVISGVSLLASLVMGKIWKNSIDKKI